MILYEDRDLLVLNKPFGLESESIGMRRLNQRSRRIPSSSSSTSKV